MKNKNPEILESSQWFVYILKCADNTFYTGISNNIERRLHEHNNTGRGARYTKSRRPVTLVYQESLESKSEALKREYRVRKLSRPQKLELIATRKHLFTPYPTLK